MKLTDEQRERYSRMLALRDFSEDNMDKIMNTTVAMLGAGGLGSPSLRLLAAIGFGRIKIVDRDIVELSNIQRQTVFNTDDIGKPKAEAAAENLALMNPEVHFDPVCVSIDDENAIDVIRGADIIVDGLDSFKARRAANKASLVLNIPYVFAGGVEYYANITTFIPGQTGCLQCVMGDAQDNPENTCALVGVSPTLLSLAAGVEVNEAVKIAIGRKPDLANRLMTIDTSTLSFDFFDIGKASDCEVCSKPIEDHIEEKDEPSVTQLCSQSFNVSAGKLMKLDLDKLAKRLDSSYHVDRKKRFLVVTIDPEVRVTVMPAGNAIVKGAPNAEAAVKLFRLVVEGKD
ncbi:MAG: HesA/MoeB/ThiF family protein [Candidatus Thorarchaeota archaeon]|nr:HesA/MoeB/ThiF family protein [Candidatus Thorarchaeota archaeon]